MNQQDPVRSASQRLWSLALSALGLLIVFNVVWTLVRPLLPILVVFAVLLVGVTVWNRRRWR